MPLALGLPGMQSGFTALLAGPPLGPLPAAAKMADIYATYAATGLFGASLPVFTGAEKAVLAATLAAIFALPVPNPAAWGTAWSAGVTTFWLAPPIAVAGPQVGVVTAVPGAASLIATLTAQVLIPFNPAPVAAALIAAALHAATQTVAATVAPPPATVVPIS
jgi:hypothetical protein